MRVLIFRAGGVANSVNHQTVSLAELAVSVKELRVQILTLSERVSHLEGTIGKRRMEDV